MQPARGGGFGHYRDYDGLSRPSQHALGHDSGSGARGSYGGRGGGSVRGRGFRPRGGGGPSGRYAGLGFIKKSYSDDVRDQVDELFSKKFKFEDEYDQWCLPDPSTVFKEEPFHVVKLLELKDQLNEIKGRLNDKELVSWHKHTHFTNRAGVIVSMLRREFQTEMCTQAWAKFHEILWTFNIVPQTASKYTSVHLCEAPGAFIASLNHFLKTHRPDCDWSWKAMTLNPYYEGNDPTAMIDQDKFMVETQEHWHHGPENSGNVVSWENVAGLKELVKKDLGDVHLVTADGSIDCTSNPGEQETLVSQLFFCEAVTALMLLKTGGSLVLKMFTTLEHRAISLLYLLSCCFSEVHVFKPATSKAGNSEQYTVCLGYKGSSVLPQKYWDRLRQCFGTSAPVNSMFPLETIPQSFLTQVSNCAIKFAKYQMDMIEENVNLYDCMRHSEKQFIVNVKELTCDTYKTRFKLKSLPREKAVVSHILLNGTHLYVTQLVQGEPGPLRRTTEHFLARMEQRKRVWQSRGKEVGPEEEEEESQPSVAKKPKLTQSEDNAHAVQHVLTALGYGSTGGKPGDKSGDLGMVAMEMEPEDVQWIKGPVNKPISKLDLKTLDGQRVTKVINSRFCRAEVLKNLAETIENSQVMQENQANEHADIVSHVTPGHALSADPPFYFGPDAINYAALDYLINFTGKGDDSQVLTFLDLAGAPSVFSHYILWRRQLMAKGWGMVRVEKPRLGPGQVIEKLAPWENFQVLGPHEGVDIRSNNSIKSLCAGVENYCPGGVKLVIGDVQDIPFGAHPPGHPEYVVKQHFLSQCICACKILYQGGMFICRVNELLSRFSAGLVYLMYRLFEEVTILKPMTSSPTSPERFLVCRGFQGCKPIVTEMLLAVNEHITDLRKSEGGRQDVLEVIPVQLLFEEQFYRFLTLSNERIARYRTKMIPSVEKYFHSPEILPKLEAQDLLRKGTLEILQLPENPSPPQQLST